MPPMLSTSFATAVVSLTWSLRLSQTIANWAAIWAASKEASNSVLVKASLMSAEKFAPKVNEPESWPHPSVPTISSAVG